MLNRWFKAAFYYLFLFCLAVGITLNSITVGAVAPVAQNLSQNLSDVSSDVAAIVQQGREFYQVGQFSAAIERWQEAKNNFSDREDKLNEAMTLNYLSLAYQQLGQWQDAESAFTESEDLLKPIIESEDEITDLATALNIAQSLNARGSWEFAQGQHQAALETWRQATKIYKDIQDEEGRIGSLINEIQALQALGLYGQAEKNSQEIQDSLEEQPDSIIKAIGWRSLGNVQRRMGKVDESITSLEESLTIFEEMEKRSPQEISVTLLSLGDTYRLRESDKTEDGESDNTEGDRNTALKYYRQAAEASISRATRIKARLNELNLLLEMSEFEDAKNLWPRIQSQLDNLEPSRTSVYAYIDLADSLGKLDEAKNAKNSSIQQRADLIAKAVQQAGELEDQRAESFARGKLGQLYEENQQWDDALSLTTQALKQAQRIQAKDISYQWLWQAGRIYQEQDKREEAIANYKEAVTILQSIRRELVAMNRDTQFDFREQIEPVYREYVNLLIEEVEFNNSLLKQGKADADKNSLLEDARDTVDLLQLAELDNFFRDACLDIDTKKPEQVDENQETATIYPIILPDKLAVIFSLPGEKELRLLPKYISEDNLRKKITYLAEKVLPIDGTQNEAKSLSQELYNLIIRDLESELDNKGVDTIAFVLDDPLRNIPMAALYDGEKYLVQKYAIALTPSLQLVNPKPLPTKLKVFIGGLSKAEGYPPLPQVEQEIEFITNIVDTTKSLLNQYFTKTAIEEAIKSASVNVIHLATHGTFSSKAEKTYIVTFPEFDDNDNRITINELGEYINSRDTYKLPPIELLILSACKTAAGDERAALGLAGFAVRAGARSTLASLWKMDDEAGALLIQHFYQELVNDPNISKAEALRRAQIELWEDELLYKTHPYYWASLVLVGNWL